MGETPPGVEALTRRQKEILRLIAQHLQAKEVARLLNISERTVKTHTEEARKRLGVATSRDAARLLAAHEATNGIGPEDRGPPRPMDDDAASAPVSDHEHTLPTERGLPVDPLERPGDRLAHAGGAGQAGPDQRNPARPADPDAHGRSGEGGIHHDRGDRLADRRLPDFERLSAVERRLASLNAFQWLGLIVVVGVLSAILVSGLIAACLGTLEGLQVLNRQIG